MADSTDNSTISAIVIVIALSVALFFVTFLYSFGMPLMWSIFFVMTAFGLVALRYVNNLISRYNTIATLKAQAGEAKSQVENLYQKRLDLVENVVEIAKGCMNYEYRPIEAAMKFSVGRSKLLGSTLETNTASLWSEKYKYSTRISDTRDILTLELQKLFLASEKYPALTTSGQFQSLRNFIIDIESELSSSRRNLNRSVFEFNKSVSIFPNNIIADKFGFTSIEFFMASKQSHAPVRKFSF